MISPTRDTARSNSACRANTASGVFKRLMLSHSCCSADVSDFPGKMSGA